jgi:hypothetical protein
MYCQHDPEAMACAICGRFLLGGVLRKCAGSGLGDRVAAGLSSIGITKERVAAVVGGPCGCPERQAAMNEAGAKWLGLPPGSTAPAEIDPETP